MPVNQGRRPAPFRVKLVHPNGPDMIRLVHENITMNHRKGREAILDFPPLITRATMVLKENRVMPTQVFREND